ncbi:MAG: GNAT family N-acetyltransferase [Gemmatimonadaceae bacterium]|nr:GNAT family N-acetyltransferase [Gemmatimonadaceae bacterium]
MTAVEIRRAMPDDAELLTPFARRVFLDTFLADNDPGAIDAYVGEAFTPEKQRAEIAFERGVCLLAFVENTLAAWALLRETKPVPPNCSVAAERPMQLDRFYVDHAWHGRGVAIALMNAAKNHTTAVNADALWLTTWERNARAIRFYEREGFVLVGETTFVLGDEVQRDVVMCAPITPAPPTV